MSSTQKHPEIVQEIPQDSGCEKTGCCSTTEDGSAVCVVPQNIPNTEVASCGCGTSASSCGCNSVASIQVNSIQKVNLSTSKPKRTLSDHLAECKSTWEKIRGGVMFVVACIASPCCTPLIVPVVLALLAGTPAAVWLGQNLGWVYGGLTLLSVVSFVLAFRWMGKNGRRTAAPTIQPVIVAGKSKNEIGSRTI